MVLGFASGTLLLLLGSFSTPNYLKDMLFNLGVVDLGYSRNKFTWHNKSWGRHAIRERLDRGIASIDWRLKFPKVIIHHLGTINSDNCPILLVTEGNIYQILPSNE